MNIKKNLTNIKNTIKSLKRFDSIVFKTATRLKYELLKNYNNGKGADDNKFKPLSDSYRDIKGASGRDPIRNLLYSGNMLQDMGPVPIQDFKYKLKFRSARERKKAQNNVKYAPNMIVPVSDRINAILQKLSFKLYKDLKK